MAVAAVDHRGRPAARASTGRWRSARFIIAVEMAERFSFFGVSFNLITYLTGPLGEGVAEAASAINIWNGVAQLLPLLGAAVADSWLGRYRTILLASVIYILALAMLALSTLLSSGSDKCGDANTPCLSPSGLQMASFYTSLYMVGLAQGGHKPCVQAFGADQFDQSDPREAASRSSFFNWWYFSISAGTAIMLVFLSYVQDNIGWGLSFGILSAMMAFSLVVFLLGTRTYRYYYIFGSKQCRLVANACEAFTSWTSSWRKQKLANPLLATSTLESRSHTDDEDHEVVISHAYLLEEAKVVLRLLVIWSTCLIYVVAFSQASTFFTKQASTLDRRVGHRLQVPPAAMQSFICITAVILLPLYDRALVPLARRYTGLPSGITMLQRIGTGLVLSLLSMVVAALVETRRLQVVMDAGLADLPDVPIPMSLWWMLPQYVLVGAAEVFTMVGLQEFFYDQVPDKLRSLGLALYLSIFGIGNFISSGLISGIDRATTTRGQSWISNNLNRGHLDYFYWVIATLSALDLLLFVFFAVTFKYKTEAFVTVTGIC
ncbi:protein NRT1/ PTR FAMILY 5.10-like [Lolium rigidum]|uniref:protein NRT1/ PTR FAMILY 5.10-like n=1 Tax=Lolium rigidum TaxID=89674 RepID=UPI001F5E2097|nr:protein NRT1/ PTR FAMILY 5.10-like [Lolium rigidum]